MHDSVGAKEKLHERYRRHVQNNIPQGQSETIAAFNRWQVKSTRVRRSLANNVSQSIDFAHDVAQSLAEEQTLNGAPTEKVLRIRRGVSYTTTPETPGA